MESAKDIIHQPKRIPSKINKSTICLSLRNMKNGWADRNHWMVSGLLKYTGRRTCTTLHKQQISTNSSELNNAEMILIHKKGSKVEIKNYRPINVLPLIYNIFTQIVINRILHNETWHNRLVLGQERTDKYVQPLVLRCIKTLKKYSIQYNPEQ